MAYPAAVPAIAIAAVASEAATGLPAILTAAQCALESGWLDYAVGNNAFGVKWHKSQPIEQRQLIRTREWFSRSYLDKWLTEPGYEGRQVIRETGRTRDTRFEFEVRDWFMKYATLADSFTAHARLIVTGAPYRKAWTEFQGHKSPEKLLIDISKNYATSPTYAVEVADVMKMPALVKAIQESRK